MMILSFSSVDTLNSKISGSGAVSYRTKTTVGIRGRKTTSLITENEQRVVGGIDWRQQQLVIAGKSWSLEELKSRGPGTLRIWHWGGRHYQVNLYDKQWMLTTERSLTPLATLQQSVINIFKPSQPATMRFDTEFSEIDQVFFLLIMIYSEIWWQDNEVDGHLPHD